MFHFHAPIEAPFRLMSCGKLGMSILTLTSLLGIFDLSLSTKKRQNCKTSWSKLLKQFYNVTKNLFTMKTVFSSSFQSKNSYMNIEVEKISSEKVSQVLRLNWKIIYLLPESSRRLLSRWGRDQSLESFLKPFIG